MATTDKILKWRIKFLVRYNYPIVFKYCSAIKSICSISNFIERKTFIKKYKEIQSTEVQEVVSFVRKKHMLGMYNYKFINQYEYRKQKVFYDAGGECTMLCIYVVME